MQYIEIKNISKQIANRTLFEDLSCAVCSGEFVYLTGISGSGKTQLLRVMAGLEKIDKGEIWVNQYPLHAIPKKRLYIHTRSVGFVFQSMKFLEKYSVADNLAVPLQIKGLPFDEIKEKVKEKASEMHIYDLLNERINKLSGGQQQLVAITRALIVNPTILFADEPTANLDWATSQYILDIFEKYHKQGGTIIFATHHREVIHKYKHRVVLLYRKSLKEIKL